MDFQGDEDAVRYALEHAFREHERETLSAHVPRTALPSANIARAFMAKLGEYRFRVVRRSMWDKGNESGRW